METTETTYQLYKDIIGVRLPWIITAVEKEEKNRKITIRIEHGTNHKISCPVCSAEAKTHDHRVRVLRYLDTCQYETFLEVHGSQGEMRTGRGAANRNTVCGKILEVYQPV